MKNSIGASGGQIRAEAQNLFNIEASGLTLQIGNAKYGLINSVGNGPRQISSQRA